MAFNVLIVDDSAAMRAVVKKTIKVSGFKVGEYWEAADGREALDILANEWVDLVLSDINMPNMNGLELLAKMSKDQDLKPIPVVMITTEGSEKSVQKSEELGAKGYIKKPFQPEDIRRILNQIMGEPEDGESEYDESDEDFDF
jgi:two-component system chemotaxis response regulator CheY